MVKWQCFTSVTATQIMADWSSLLRGILDGLAWPASSTGAPTYPKLRGTDISRMRQDVIRVGNDFNSVIHQEPVKREAIRVRGHP